MPKLCPSSWRPERSGGRHQQHTRTRIVNRAHRRPSDALLADLPKPAESRVQTQLRSDSIAAVAIANRRTSQIFPRIRRWTCSVCPTGPDTSRARSLDCPLQRPTGGRCGRDLRSTRARPRVDRHRAARPKSTCKDDNDDHRALRSTDPSPAPFAMPARRSTRVVAHLTPSKICRVRRPRLVCPLTFRVGAKEFAAMSRMSASDGEQTS